MDMAGKIIDLLSMRGPKASICPSDIARALADGEMAWRALMPAVREAAASSSHKAISELTPMTPIAASYDCGDGLHTDERTGHPPPKAITGFARYRLDTHKRTIDMAARLPQSGQPSRHTE
ncbi:hypothetical protein HDE79_003925 [Rhodanobacter sp. MP1X3]|nr:hypothetical protein [Rhodanobacter sp. MP1X3]